MLLESVDEETGEAMSDKLLRDELITMVSAGHETTANALSFALYLLSVHPEWMRAVHDEAHAVFGSGAPDVADVNHLVTASMVIEEAMRLYPPVWVFERRALAPDRLGESRPTCFIGHPPYGTTRRASIRRDGRPLRRNRVTSTPTCRSAEGRARASGTSSRSPRRPSCSRSSYGNSGSRPSPDVRSRSMPW
jgi:hypothetical protein